MIQESTINEILDKIISGTNPDKIILFGSYGIGSPNENSDLDLLVVKDTDLPLHQRGREIRRLLLDSLVPIDILVYTKKELEEVKDLKFSFLYDVLKTGKVVYER
ncbi:MAG: nucleotidyltransferase domain-containing protein [FCB group bacterium]|jgi:predicted nucleotidyltransferase